MSLSRQIVSNGIAAKALAARDGNGLSALVHRAATQLASAATAAEVLDARDLASVAYDAAKKAARLHRAKGAHDELVAKAHRAQADALLIESEAKRRLADEYDAAQERGEVRTVGNVPEQNNTPTAADVGLTRKDIHEARQIRDAENAEPGIVEKAVNEALASGQEPTKAKVRKAIEQANAEPDTTDAKEPAGSNWYRPKIVVPDGADIVALIKRGLKVEEDGASADQAVAASELSLKVYRLGRQIVLLAENPDLSAKHVALAKQALAMMQGGQISAAWDVAAPLAERVWGEGKKDGLLGLAAKRLDQFERSFGIVIQACMTTDEIELPYLSAEQAAKAARQIGAARGALERFAKRIKGIHE